jgi:hypothetical protein
MNILLIIILALIWIVSIVLIYMFKLFIFSNTLIKEHEQWYDIILVVILAPIWIGIGTFIFLRLVIVFYKLEKKWKKSPTLTQSENNKHEH